MDPLRQLFRLALLGAINHQVTHLCVAGSIFEETRQSFKRVHPKLGLLVTCHLCFGTWVGFLLALVFRPRFIEAGRGELPLQRPSRARQIAAFFADTFAISLAGRFYTEALAILAGQAAVKKEQRELLEVQVDHARDEAEADTGEPLAKSV